MAKYLILLLFFSTSFEDPGSQVDEMTMKAIYVERFARFVEWPNHMQGDFFRIQVIGDKELALTFRKIFKKLEIKSKTVLIHQHEDTYNKNFKPHVVYVADKKRIRHIIERVNIDPVLIVSEGSGGAKEGAMINIFRKGTRLKFEINEQSMHESPLYISYRLKKAAFRIVDPVKNH